jgi:SAM-dependent methyltransferase
MTVDRHSIETLNLLYEYDDFMYSIQSLIDLGCGMGQDLEWWATRTTRDDNPKPLHIRCTGVDLAENLPLAKRYDNIDYQLIDFEDPNISLFPGGYDILWCHDSFQYAKNPLQTLKQWWHLASTGGMLYICVPVTQRLHRRQFDFKLSSGCYYHYTLVNLMYMLATTGWDCGAGFFKQSPQDDWLQAVVYKSEHQPRDPKNTTWYDLSELKLLPASADKSIHAHGCLHQQDLIIPWLDRSLTSMFIQ